MLGTQAGRQAGTGTRMARDLFPRCTERTIDPHGTNKTLKAQKMAKLV